MLSKGLTSKFECSAALLGLGLANFDQRRAGKPGLKLLKLASYGHSDATQDAHHKCHTAGVSEGNRNTNQSQVEGIQSQVVSNMSQGHLTSYLCCSPDVII